jgi:hypothetical protein
MDNESIADNGGRRSGIDRRQFSYSEHIPERRDDKDRRSGVDRRNVGFETIGDRERRSVFDIK